MSEFKVNTNMVTYGVNDAVFARRGIDTYGTDEDGNNVFVNVLAPSGLTGATTYNMYLPKDKGTNGQILATNGGGQLYWTNASSGGAIQTDSNENIWIEDSNISANQPLGNDNIVFGNNAGGTGAGLGGNRNIAIGTNTMINAIDADYTIAIGYGAVPAGDANIGIGYNSLASVTNGTHNVAVGNETNVLNASSFNVLIGSYADINGNQSVSVGANSSALNNNCVSIGYLCVATDPNSLALGALSAVQGSNSIAIGYNSAATGTSQNVTVIGPNSTIQGNDAVLIGSAANVSGATGGSVFIKHRVLASVGNVAHFVPGGGGTPITTELYENSSSQRYKMDIKDYEPDLKKFEQIRPVIYRAKPGFSAIPNDQRYYPGFIAEEINTVFPEYVAYDSDGITPANVFYDKIVTLLVKKVQELEREIKEIKQNLN